MIRPDDLSVTDDVEFLRALPIPDWWKQMADRIRVCSVAFFTFDKEPGETSCYRNTRAGRAVFGRRYPSDPAARFTAGQARGEGFNVTCDPDGDDESSPEHFVLTYRLGGKRNPYQSSCKKLALKAEYVSKEAVAIERCADLSS